MAGLDLSQRSAGVAIIDASGSVHTYTFGSDLSKTSTERQKTWRNIEIANGIINAFKGHAVRAVGVEAYAFSRKATSVHGLAELGGLVKAQLLLGLNLSPYPMPASSMRKFLFGKNTSDKKAIRNKLVEMGYAQPTNTDESDALVVALVVDAYSNRRSAHCEQHELELFDRLDARAS